MATDVIVLDHLGNSDHNIVVWGLVCAMLRCTSKVPFRQCHKADYVAMREWLSKVDWDREYKDLDVDEILFKFITLSRRQRVLVGYHKC